jgi:GH25 family lysozyme M1 (1,4-beta-N-acetylmuramidase)
MTIQILDIYQGNKYDPGQEAATGTDAVLIKGGQGEYQDYEDHKCTYIDQTKQVNLPVGIFWQMDARYSPEKHKAAIKAFYDRHGFGELGLWLACEKPFYPCPDWLYSRMPYAFYKPIESVWRGIMDYTGKVPGIYTSPGMWRLIFGQCPLVLQQEFAAKANLWAAQYQVAKPDRIGQWYSWWFWQYQAEPDYSIFSESDDIFRFLYGATNPAPAPEPPPVTPPVTPPQAVWTIAEQNDSQISLKKG